jgi:adenine deaminase
LQSALTRRKSEKFTRVFKAAAERGLLKVAHAGEEGPPAYVYGALDTLDVHRIDHGNRSMEDPHLVTRLVRDGMTLTVCPLSNVKLRVVKNMQEHPLPKMLSEGLRVTVNSDDPAYFGGYINENFNAITHAGLVDRKHLVELAKNSFLGSFLNHEEVRSHLNAIDAYAVQDRKHPSSAQ